MPAFTAVAAYLVAEIGGIALAAAVGSAGITLITSVVATGIAALTARVINGGGSSGSGGTQQDPGVRIQLPPATDNKVPVIYGTANTKGICVDARISDDNQQMTYVLVLGEKTQTGTFTVGDIFWNDQLLAFDSGSNNYKVVSSVDQNGLGSTSTNLAGLIEVRVYAGSAQSSTNQIFPTTNKVSAASYVGESTSTYMLSDLVYAVVKLNYSSEKGVTALAQMTFEVSNSLSNPGLVIYDYLTSLRYGAGIDSTQIDTLSMTSTVTNTSLYSISNEIPPDQFESNGTTPSTQARYVINGVLSTGETNKNNLEKITQACASWLTYDFVQGKWKIVVNRALGVSELANVITYDDDTIIGEVNVNATNLEDLYNAIEIEFPSREIRDQNDYYRAEIAAVDRNDLEPDNVLNLRFDLINNGIHAQRLGLIELLQSRVDKTIQFKTTYKGLQTNAGDVIKVTNEVYGFNEKLFRVTRVREVEDEAGGITCEITGLEYDADIYTDSSITDYQPNTPSGIPSFGGPVALPAPGIVTIGGQYPSANQPYFQVSTVIDATSGPVDQILWYYATAGGTPSSYTYVTNEVGPFYAGQTVTDTIVGLPADDYWIFARSVKDGSYSDYSQPGAVVPGPTPDTNEVNWNPQPGGVSNGSISTATFSSQVQVVNTTSGALKIPLVATTSGYQPVYADSELSYDAGSNVLSVGGLSVSTGTQVAQLISSGGFPLNGSGQAMIANGSTASVAMVVSNYTAGLLPRLSVRAYGQNTPGGTPTSVGGSQLILEGARGTSVAPTASGSGDSVGSIQFGGYDGANWLSNQNTAGVISLPPATIFVNAAEAFANNGSATTNAGTTMGFRIQPPASQLNSTSRRIFIGQTWTAGSTTTNSPPVLNMGMGQGSGDGAIPTLTPASGVGSFGTGSGRTNWAWNGATHLIYGIPAQDTAPDNATLTATNIVTFISGRRNWFSGRRDALVSGDTVGQFNYNAQTAASQTGNGSTVGSTTFSMLEAAGASARGTQFVVNTVNTGTTTLATRMALRDRDSTFNSDSHVFKDKSSTFTALTVTTATTTVNGTLNAPGTYHCEVSRNSTQAIASVTDNILIQFNNKTSDPQNWYSTSTYKITPTVSGYYMVDLQVAFSGGTGTGQNNIQIRKNGTTTVSIAQDDLYTGSQHRTLSCFAIVQLNGSSDWIEATAYNSGSASQDVYTDGNPSWTKMSLTKLQ